MNDAFDTPATPQAATAVTHDAFDDPTPSASPLTTVASGATPTGPTQMRDAFDDIPNQAPVTQGPSQPQQRVGPSGQPNPRNVYAAAPEEGTPEGAAKALAARQAAHPIISGVGQGAENLLQPFFHPLDTVENLVKSSIPGYEIPSQIKKSYGLLQQYETSRSQGKSIWQSIADVNELAKKQDAAQQAVDRAVAEYKKNPTQATAKVLTEVVGNIAMLVAGGKGAAMESEAPAAVAEVPAAETEAAAAARTANPGIVKQIIKGAKVNQPGAQAAVREGAQASVESSNAAAAAREAEATHIYDAKSGTVKPTANVGAAKPTVNVPPEYKALVDDAMKEPPQWTPETAKPIADELGKDFEVRGSVGEGKPTNNDLDVWQSAKDGELSDAAATLKKHGFERVDSTPHGETWTNTKTGQNIDLWDNEHEPKVGFGADTADTEINVDEPTRANTSAKSAAIDKEGALLEGKKSIIDEHLNTLAQNEKAAYQELDKTAGFDLKAEKQALANDKYKLSQLGNTDPDITQRGNLIESINDSTDRIAEAEQKLKDAGIDPSVPDQLHKQRMAGGDFRKSLVKNTNPDGSVNVKGLWNDARNMRNSKYGDRLEQFFGSKEAADAYQAKLAAMEKLGAHAVTARKVAAWTAAALGVSGLAGKVLHVGAELVP